MTTNKPPDVKPLQFSIKRDRWCENLVGFNEHGPMWSTHAASAMRVGANQIEEIMRRIMEDRDERLSANLVDQ